MIIYAVIVLTVYNFYKVVLLLLCTMRTMDGNRILRLILYVIRPRIYMLHMLFRFYHICMYILDAGVDPKQYVDYLMIAESAAF
jgi:hypothetical protein